MRFRRGLQTRKTKRNRQTEPPAAPPRETIPPDHDSPRRLMNRIDRKLSFAPSSISNNPHSIEKEYWMNCAVHTEAEAGRILRETAVKLCVGQWRARALSVARCTASCACPRWLQNRRLRRAPIRDKSLARHFGLGWGPWVGGGLQWRVREGAGSRGDFRGPRHDECARALTSRFWGTHSCGFSFATCRSRRSLWHRDRSVKQPATNSEVPRPTRAPIGPIVLIVLGVLFSARQSSRSAN